MKIQYLLLILPSLLYTTLFAQNNATIIVKAGTTIKESVSPRDLYEYPQFTHGTVFTRGGKSSGAKMNYNLFLDEMQFITDKGDTLTLINKKNIAFVSIATDTFFYDRGYIKLMSSTSNVKLGRKQMLTLIDKEKLGGYGMTSSTTSIDSYNSYNDGRRDYDLTVMQDIILGKKVQYYVGDVYNHFVLATKKNLIKLFPKQETALNNFLRDNVVAFNNKDDLEKVVQFLAQL